MVSERLAKRSALNMIEQGELFRHCSRKAPGEPPYGIFRKVLSEELARVKEPEGGLGPFLEKAHPALLKAARAELAREMETAKKGIYNQALLPVLFEEPTKQRIITFELLETEHPGVQRTGLLINRFDEVIACICAANCPGGKMGAEYSDDFRTLLFHYDIRMGQGFDDSGKRSPEGMMEFYMRNFCDYLIDGWNRNLWPKVGIMLSLMIDDTSEEKLGQFLARGTEYLKKNKDGIVCSLSARLECAIRKIAVTKV